MKKIIAIIFIACASSVYASQIAIESPQAQPENKPLSDFDQRQTKYAESWKQLEELNYESMGSGYIIGALLAACNKALHGNNVPYTSIAAVLLSPLVFTQLKNKDNPVFYKDPTNYYPYCCSVLASTISFVGFSFMLSKIFGVSDDVNHYENSN